MKTFKDLKIGDTLYCIMSTYDGLVVIKTLLIKDIQDIGSSYCFSGLWDENNNSYVYWLVSIYHINSISTNDAATTPESAKNVFWKRISNANMSKRFMIRAHKKRIL